MVNKNTIITAVGVIGVVILAFVLRPTIVVQPAPVQVVTQPSTSLGALAGPDIPWPYLGVGGQRDWRDGKAFTLNATSTLYSVEVPYATSTIPVGGVACLVKNSSGATQNFELGYGTNSNSTTTVLARAQVLNGDYAEIVATTTATALTDGVVIPTRTTDRRWINFRVASGTPGTLATAFSGGCMSVFRQIAP